MWTIDLSNINHKKIYLFIVLITFILYGNGINNEYSLDDNIVVEGVEKVNKGLKGIPEIFTTNYAVDKKQNYGYRPLVLASFAIEKQLFRGLPAKQLKEKKEKRDKLTQANVSHFINVLFYALTGVFLFRLLLLVFKEYNILVPLLVTVLFIVHPLHTEPVDNIKSRDELMMFLFMILALIQYHKFTFTNKYINLIYAAVFVLFSLLSKKTGIVILGVIPVVLYFCRADWKKTALSTLSVLLIIGLIVFMKKNLLTAGNERVSNFYENPLFFEGGLLDRIATGFYCAWFYLMKLLFPKDLAFYYGYSEIPIVNWSFYKVWLAILIYVPLLFYGLWRFVRRDILGLGILLWLGVMFAYLNILSPIVGVVAERFTYVFSLGFCILFAILLLRLFKVNTNKAVSRIELPTRFLLVVGLIVVIYSGRTIARNPDWHDYLTTYRHDIDVVEKSAKAHALLANELYATIARDPKNAQNRAYVTEMISHYKQALSIDSTYLTCYNNLGSVYLNMLHDNQKAKKYFKAAVNSDSTYVEAVFNLGVAYSRMNQPGYAFRCFYQAIELDPEYLSTYQHLSDLLVKTKRVNAGVNRLTELAVQVKYPKNIYISIGRLYAQDVSKTALSISYFEKAFELDPKDIRVANYLIDLYESKGNLERANYYRQRLIH